MSVCFQITPSAPAFVRDNLAYIERRAADFWARIPQARIISQIRGASFGERIAALPVTSDWRRPYLNEQRDRYDALSGTLSTVAHYLALWPDHQTYLPVLQSNLPDALQVPRVEACPFPHLIGGQYREHPTYLHPVRRDDPYLAVLTAYDVRGGWAQIDIEEFRSWQRLLALNLPLTLAIDVQTLSSFDVAKKIQYAHNRILTADQEADVQLIEQHSQSHAIHMLRYAILLAAPTRDELDAAEQEVQTACGSMISFARLQHAQARHSQFFQDVPPRHIATPLPKCNTLSYGVGCKLPFAVRREVQQHGVLLGTDREAKLPLHYHMLGPDGRQNANLLIAGKSGFGKTTAQMTWALRLALQGAQVICLEPSLFCDKLERAIGDDRACTLYDVQQSQAVNILDVVSSNPEDQQDSVVRKLEVALGKPKDVGGRVTMVPRELSNAEIGALGEALAHPCIYGPDYHRMSDLTTEDTPRLSDLVAVLQEIQEREAARTLAVDISDRLLNSAARRVYDQPTSLAFNHHADVLLYSFQGVPPERLPLVYDYIFSRIDRYIWAPGRNVDRPLFLIIDEFFYMASVQSLELRVVKATKTWRSRFAACWTADQNIETYLGEHGSVGGPFIRENTRQKAFFQLEDGAPLLEQLYPDRITKVVGQQLRALGRGQCLAILDGEVKLVDVELTDLERRSLLPKG